MGSSHQGAPGSPSTEQVRRASLQRVLWPPKYREAKHLKCCSPNLCSPKLRTMGHNPCSCSPAPRKLSGAWWLPLRICPRKFGEGGHPQAGTREAPRPSLLQLSPLRTDLNATGPGTVGPSVQILLRVSGGLHCSRPSTKKFENLCAPCILTLKLSACPYS